VVGPPAIGAATTGSSDSRNPVTRAAFPEPLTSPPPYDHASARASEAVSEGRGRRRARLRRDDLDALFPGLLDVAIPQGREVMAGF